MWALYLKEIRGFLSTVVGYVFIAVFLLLNSLFLWVFTYETNLLEGGTADLFPFFNTAPIVFIILIPAITMRAFSEEKRTGTIELLLTHPLSDSAIVLAKYLAGLTLVCIALLPTLVYYYTVHALGKPVGSIDDAATVTSYIGLLCMGACFVAIGVFASSTTGSQIVAFIAAVVLSWFLFLGLDLLAVYSQFGPLDAPLKKLGMMEHYKAIQKGVIDTRDVVYFVSFALVFLLLTKLVLQSRKW